MNPYIQYMYSYPHKTAYRPLKNIFLQDYAHLLSGCGHGLYLHIPFCQTKCGYCNLFSVTGQDTAQLNRYLDTVERQSRQYHEILSAFPSEFSDITIGGGTPLLLSENQLECMFFILEKYFLHSEHSERIIETAPNQTNSGKLRILKQAGITRISMGIQSFSDQELQTLGRQHSSQTAKKALEVLKAFDFPCINVDFIYGIPGQTVKSLLKSLTEALSFEPDEIFLYPLYINHGAWLSRTFPAARTRMPDPAIVYQQYREASAFLKREGFRQDSMRRFVRKQTDSEKEERRTYSACGFSTSLALGCGGRSYLGNLHFCTPYAITGRECLGQIKAFMDTDDFSQITHGILLSRDEMARRYVIRHLLIQPGLNLQHYKETFGTEAMEDFPLLHDWSNQRFTQIIRIKHTDYLALTETGLGLSDYLGPQLISAQIREKMKEWEAAHERKNHIIPGQPEKL